MKEMTLEKVMERKYSAYVRKLAKENEAAIPDSFAVWLEKFKDQVVSDTIEITPEFLSALKEIGFEVKPYAPKTGLDKGITKNYLVNPLGRTTSGGFLPLNRSGLKLIRDRMILNVEAIDLALSQD